MSTIIHTFESTNKNYKNKKLKIMPRNMSRGAKRKLIPEGEYLVRVLTMIDEGTQEDQQGREKLSLRITFEMIEEIETFTRQDGTSITGPRLYTPFTYNQTLSKNATLFKLCKAILGSKATKDDFTDPTEIVGKYVMIDVIHQISKNTNEPYEKIADYFRASNDDVEEAVKNGYDPNQNQCFAWWLEEGTDWGKLDDFPDWLQDRIMSSPEYEELEDDRNKPKSKKVKKTGLDLDEDEEEKPKRTRKSRKKEVVEEESDY